MATEHQLRQELIRFSHLCYERNLLVAMDGNLSALLSSGEVLCTKAGCHKGFVTDDDLVVVDRKGRKVRGSGQPTSEMLMHLARAHGGVRDDGHGHAGRLDPPVYPAP